MTDAFNWDEIKTLWSKNECKSRLKFESLNNLINQLNSNYCSRKKLAKMHLTILLIYQIIE